VGDTQGDADAARSCGVPFVFARYGFGKADHFDFAIGSFDELPKKLHPLQRALRSTPGDQESVIVLTQSSKSSGTISCT
jgi:phosphoglycolate phosphatase-like HAD superfamily hydrolase